MAYVFRFDLRVGVIRRASYRTYVRVFRYDFFDFCVGYFVRLILDVRLRCGCTYVAFGQDARLVRLDGQDVNACREFTAARDQCVDEDYGDCVFCEIARDIDR